MLNIHDLSSEFEDRKSAIINYERETSGELEEYKKALPNPDHADAFLNNTLPQYSGAKLFELGEVIRRFHPATSWKNREDAIS